jgi:hypothetical protein
VSQKNPSSKWSEVQKSLGITALECWLRENVSHPTLLEPSSNSFLLFKFLPCMLNKHHVCSMAHTKIVTKQPEEYSTLLSGTASATSTQAYYNCVKWWMHTRLVSCNNKATRPAALHCMYSNTLKPG